MARSKILFVDDDSFLRKVYQAELKEKGFDIELAVDGEDALQKIRTLDPDLVILDLIMPKKSGFEVLTDMAKDPLLRVTPVIVLSNLAQSIDKKRAIDLGAVEYLVKDNTTLDVIADKINYFLSSSSQSKEARRKSMPASRNEVDVTTSEHTFKAQATETLRKPTPLATSTKVAHNFCPQCGAKVKSTDKFCPQCGAVQ